MVVLAGGDLAMFPTLADKDDVDLFLLVHIGQFYKKHLNKMN